MRTLSTFCNAWWSVALEVCRCGLSIPFCLFVQKKIRTLSNIVNNTDWVLPSHSAHHVELMKLCTATNSLNSWLTTAVTAVCCTMPDIAFAQTHTGIHTQVSQLTVLGAATRTCVPHVCINLFQNFRCLHPTPLLHLLFSCLWKMQQLHYFIHLFAA